MILHKYQSLEQPEVGPAGDLGGDMSSKRELQNSETNDDEKSTKHSQESEGSSPNGEGDFFPLKKKKKKSKHHSESAPQEIKKKNREYTDMDKMETEELPKLESKGSLDSCGNKRKPSFENDIQKERPVKMVKTHCETYRPFTQSGDNSFADELASFKKDLERSKHKKEKKEKRRNKGEVETCSGDQAEPSETSQTEAGSSEAKDIDEDDLTQLRKLLRDRKKQLKDVPMVRLKATGKDADLEHLDQPRLPILPCDVQNFLLLSQLTSDCPRYPRWIELKKMSRVSKTVVLIVEGLSAYDFLNEESKCETLKNMDVKAEVVSPYCYNSSVVEELCAVPLTREQKKNLEKRFGKEICPEALLTDKVIKVLRSAFSISSVTKTKNEEVEKKITVPTTDQFPRTELLLSAWQLIEEGYPLPYGSNELGNRYPDYVMTKDQYSEVTPSSPLWALDCEMCLTRAGNELTRVSVVNEEHETVYESFCLPRNPIKNYLTEFSGITAEMLRGCTVRLEDIQKDLRELFPPDVILVGQSLGGDLHALKMMHPYVIDTSVIFNLSGQRRRKSKLSALAKEFLGEAIQQRGAEGHDSVEDSLAALKLVQHKLKKSIEYGDAVLAGFSEMPSLDSKHDDANSSQAEHKAEEFDALKVEVGPTMATSLFKHFTMKKKTVSVVGLEETLAEYSTFVAAAHRENKQLIKTQTTESNQQTIDRMCQLCKETNFTLGHLVLSEEETITKVDSWLGRLYNCPPFNSLFITVFVGSHKSFANGAVFVKVKKPKMKLKT